MGKYGDKKQARIESPPSCNPSGKSFSLMQVPVFCLLPVNLRDEVVIRLRILDTDRAVRITLKCGTSLTANLFYRDIR
ncbi:hypothetical protein UNDYM_4449 [Undibacterium sp. YM2]|nr:hypothetical protein UNDYM_4449 [Undibacterium sp. YM2]